MHGKEALPPFMAHTKPAAMRIRSPYLRQTRAVSLVGGCDKGETDTIFHILLFSVPAFLPTVSSLSLTGGVPGVGNRRRTSALSRPPAEGGCFFGKRGTKKERLGHSSSGEMVIGNDHMPPSFCLRDSARGPCTFGTQLNEILQRSLRDQFPAILTASSGHMRLRFTTNRITWFQGKINGKYQKNLWKA